MERKYKVKSKETLDTVSRLLDRGIRHMSLILRHSARFYHTDYKKEPFMGLTDAGKSFAFDFGKCLPEVIAPTLYASSFSRCIETAYLIDKGYTSIHGTSLPHPQTHDLLAPFYINDLKRGVAAMQASGTQTFIRNWFDKKIDESIILNPERTADALTQLMTQHLSDLSDNEIAICITHDWNIFPILEFKFGVPFETVGDVDYLEGVIFYIENGRTMAITNRLDPIAV